MSRFSSWFFHRFLPWVVLTHALTFIIFWLTNSLFYASSNDYLAKMLGKRLDYVSLLLWVSAFIALWSGLRGVLGRLGRTHKLAVVTAWVYGFVSVLYVVFFYGSFWLLFRESPVQLVRLGQLIGYFRLILDTLLLLGLALLGGFWLSIFLARRQRAGKRVHGGLWVMCVVGYLILWSLPVIFPPGSVIRDRLPDKPLIIAHRGASMLAPENTLAAANLAAQIGVAGLETDIQVSQDGQLFLMHDDTLARTTDVASVFPGRQDEPAGDFTVAEVRQLNAGEWFVAQDPFGTIRRGLVTPEQVQEYRQQTVPLLSAWLDIVRTDNLVFIFDLKQPPKDNPFASTIFALTLSQLQKSVNGSLVWFLVNPSQLRMLRQVSPEIVPAYGVDYRSPPAATRLQQEGYLVVNAEYGLDRWWIRNFEQAGLWVNLYTVDEPWQFSRLWLLQVNSVTTSNVQVMADLSRPTFSLYWSQYLLVWGLVGLLGLGVGVGLVLPIIKSHRVTRPLHKS